MESIQQQTARYSNYTTMTGSGVAATEIGHTCVQNLLRPNRGGGAISSGTERVTNNTGTVFCITDVGGSADIEC